LVAIIGLAKYTKRSFALLNIECTQDALFSSSSVSSCCPVMFQDGICQRAAGFDRFAADGVT
jgi:hypothetical protein